MLRDNENLLGSEEDERLFKMVLNARNSSFLKELAKILSQQILVYEGLAASCKNSETTDDTLIVKSFLKEFEQGYLSAKIYLPFVNEILADRNVNPEHN